jgi:EmrB/QacA subfamily drug resistance transporter
VNEPLPRWRAFPALALGVVMATLDISVVNIALPTLSRTFGVPLTRIEWVVLGYVVTLTGLLLTVGRIADQAGRRRVYGAGLALFALASALCGAAPTAAALVAARVLQGMGACMMSATSVALLVSGFPPEERGRALGAFGAMVGLGLAIGTPLGGLVIAHASWRWLFFINLPLAAVAGWLLATRVPADAHPPRRARIDVGAAIAWCGALVSLMLALSRGPELGWGNLGVWPLFAGAALLFALFAVLEQRASDPLLPMRLVQGPLGIAVMLTLVSQALSIAVAFHMPLYLEDVLGWTAAASGRWLSILPLAALVAAPLSGRIADRVGTRAVAAFGMALTVGGFALLAGLGDRMEAGRMFGGLALVGLGQGLFAVPNASALLALVPRELLGFASGLQGTMRNLGIASGSAGVAALLATRYARHAGQALPVAGALTMNRGAFAAATREAFMAMAALALLATLVALTQRGAPGRNRAEIA